jgi:hypothetical protein
MSFRRCSAFEDLSLDTLGDVPDPSILYSYQFLYLPLNLTSQDFRINCILLFYRSHPVNGCNTVMTFNLVDDLGS